MTVLRKQPNNYKPSIFQDGELEDLLNRSLRYLKTGYPVHFTGPSGAGKTSLAVELAKRKKKPVMLIHGNHELNNKDLIGDFTGYTSKSVIDNYIRSVYKKEENMTETWKDGRLLEAVKNGYTLIYDEFTRSRPETNNIFLSILEEGILPLYGTKLTEPFVRVHPDFSLIFTSNPAEYAGVYQTQDALLDRMVTLHIGHKDSKREAAILTEKMAMNKSEAMAITSLVAGLRDLCEGEGGPSFRASLMIAKVASDECIPIDGKDPSFQRLCIDIAGHQISRCLDNINSVEDVIVTACKNMKNHEEQRSE